MFKDRITRTAKVLLHLRRGSATPGAGRMALERAEPAGFRGGLRSLDWFGGSDGGDVYGFGALVASLRVIIDLGALLE